MLGKRTRPRILGKLPDPLISAGSRFGYPEMITSPKNPFELRVLSPRSSLNNSYLGGIGLGFVAALEKTSDGQAKSRAAEARSNPITIGGRPQKSELGCVESYTYVTSRKPNESFNKVYYCDKGDQNVGVGHDRNCYDDRRLDNLGFFYESPPRFVEVSCAFPASDFLSFCYLCRKNLHGKDIYMYRGEKAFCSVECRCRQIGIDERKEKCGSEVSRSADISGSPYSRENFFFTGIIAA